MNQTETLAPRRRSIFQRYVTSVFQCDTRSLALFRMVLACLVLADVALRVPSIPDLYTDSGYFTRDLADQYNRLMVGSDSFEYWSWHKLSGEAEFQYLLFGITAVAAGLLLVGWQTRWMSILIWMLVASMQVRNGLGITSGDVFLKMLLFWGMFLPLGAIWSLDARRRRRPVIPRRVVNAATVGVILQLCFLYWFTGLAKCNEIWFRGDGLEYVMKLDIYARDTAQWMLELPWLMKLASWSTVFGQLFLPTLLLLPWWTTYMRWLNIGFFWSMHLSIFATLSIGLFSFNSMAGWLPLIPKSFWEFRAVRSVTCWLDWLFAPRNSDSAPRSRRVTSLDSNPIGTSETPDRSGAPTSPQPTVVSDVGPGSLAGQRQAVQWRRGGRRLLNLACTMFILFFLFWNLGNIHPSFMPSAMGKVGMGFNLNQHFQMFGVPPLHSPWFVYEARLADGTRIDILRNAPVDFSKPESVRESIPTFYWRKVHRNLVMPHLEPFRQPLAEYMVEQWNRRHGPDQQVVYMKLTCVLEDLNPDAGPGDHITQVWGQYGQPTFRDMLETMPESPDLLGF